MSEPERHVLKRRPGRRESAFVGRSQLVDGRRVVETGWIVKRVQPRRAGALVERYETLARALAPGRGLPRVPMLVDHCVAEGRLTFEAVPGSPLSAWPDGVARADRLATSIAALCVLERAEDVAARWPARRWSAQAEVARLRELAVATHQALPGFSSSLFDRLEAAERRFGFVAAHRDLNEEQIIARADVPDDGIARWIDWDEAALAPLGLDLGNLFAHERLRSLRAGQTPRDGASLRLVYRACGGRASDPEIDAWEAVACLRLALLVRGTPVERNPEWVPLPPEDGAEAGQRAAALQAIAAELAAR